MPIQPGVLFARLQTSELAVHIPASTRCGQQQALLSGSPPEAPRHHQTIQEGGWSPAGGGLRVRIWGDVGWGTGDYHHSVGGSRHVGNQEG